MKINWFSPLPPAMSEIANHTLRILPALQRHADVILWTDQTDRDPGLENLAPVRRFHPDQMPWDDLNRADLSIFNIGNNRLFHGAIWQVSRRHPGLVILHDLALQHFFLGFYKERLQDRNGYVERMAFHYGEPGKACAEMVWDGRITADKAAEAFPLTPLALEQARGVMVHTPGAFEDLKKENRWPVRYAPLPYAAGPSAGGAFRSVGMKASGPPYNMILFGYLGSNRRIDVLLKALADFPDRDRFRLSIYGQLEPSNGIQALIDALGLNELVAVRGFVPEEELDRALAAAHLAVNLRYPTMGEASASQLRIWHHGLPSLVSRVGWYATLPPEAVAFVRPEKEIEDIRQHLQVFIEDPGRFARMGDAGRRILEESHAPEAYAQAIVDLAGEIAGIQPFAIADRLTARCAAEMTVWSHTVALDRTIDATAQRIMDLCRNGDQGQS